MHLLQMKEEVPLDETYAVLKRVARGDFVFLDYKNGVGPQIEIKYKKGNKKFIHQASQRWTKFSGKNKKKYMYFLFMLTQGLDGISISCFLTLNFLETS